MKNLQEIIEAKIATENLISSEMKSEKPDTEKIEKWSSVLKGTINTMKDYLSGNVQVSDLSETVIENLDNDMFSHIPLSIMADLDTSEMIAFSKRVAGLKTLELESEVRSAITANEGLINTINESMKKNKFNSLVVRIPRTDGVDGDIELAISGKVSRKISNTGNVTVQADTTYLKDISHAREVFNVPKDTKRVDKYVRDLGYKWSSSDVDGYTYKVTKK